MIHCFNCNKVPNIDDELATYLKDYLKDSNDNINEKLFNYIQTQPKLNSKPLIIPFNEIKPVINEVVLKYLAKYKIDLTKNKKK